MLHPADRDCAAAVESMDAHGLSLAVETGRTGRHLRAVARAASYRPERPKVAVILAAGMGSRIGSGKHAPPKPLIGVGGLHLLERSILTLHAAGIERFRVVVGAYRDEVVAEASSWKSIRDLDVTFVDCPDFAIGNGRSLAAGARDVEDGFLLTMADHVMVAGTVTGFIDALERGCDRPTLATDTRIAEVFDLDDATKVRTEKSRIVEIGKEIAEYDQIDTGLFYFPPSSGPLIGQLSDAGARSVSEIVAALNEEVGFFTAPLDEAVWQDVDDDSMAKEAERRLLAALFDPVADPTGRVHTWLRVRLSRRFARLRVHADSIRASVLALTLVASAIAAFGGRLGLVLAGALFYLTSVVEGCASPVARMTFRGATRRSWRMAMADVVRYGVFFGAVAIGAWKTGADSLVLWGLPLLAVAIAHLVAVLVRESSVSGHVQPGAVLLKNLQNVARRAGGWERFVAPVRAVAGRDAWILAAAFLLLAGMPSAVFWLALAVAAIGGVIAPVLLRADGTDMAADAGRNLRLVFFLLGAAVLVLLISRMPIDAMWTSLAQVGTGVLIVFATAPLWFLANAFALGSLTSGRVPLLDLLYNQLTGEAYNAIIPAAGVGGEPYKARHLSGWMPAAEATRAVVDDRLVHAVSGTLFTALGGFLTLWLVELDATVQVALGALSGVLFALACAMSWLTLSTVPSRVAGAALKKLRFLREFHARRLDPRVFSVALGFKMLGRVLNLVEIAAIFYVLQLYVGVAEIIAVSTLISAVSVLFFVVPQGLGVAEAGVTGAFTLLGMAPHLGLAFGLIRRARIVFWALIGVGMHAVSAVISRARSRVGA